MKIIVTDGAACVGWHVVRRLVKMDADYQDIDLYKLTSAGNLANLMDVERQSNYRL